MAETEEFGSVLEDTDTIMENSEVESCSHDFGRGKAYRVLFFI